jgi:cytochrome c-type biogenesis protein CcmH/NrfG
MKDEKCQKRPELFLAQGECLMQMKKFADARGCFENAVQLAPSNAQALTSLAKAALELNDLRRADIAVRKAMALDGQSSEVYLLCGYVRLRESKDKEALAAFQRASQLDHSDTVSLCMVGYVLEKHGKGQQAMEYYGRALKLKPDDEMARQMMASIDAND